MERIEQDAGATDADADDARPHKRHGFLKFLAFLLACALVLGGTAIVRHIHMQHEMTQIVHSKEATKLIRRGLIVTDPKAFTKDGVIQTYEIDDKTIRRNPMDGIDATVYANKNHELYVFFNFNYDIIDNDDSLKGGSDGCSAQLYQLVERKEGPQPEKVPPTSQPDSRGSQ